MQSLQLVGVAASLLSCVCWLTGAAVGLRRLSLFKFGGPDSIPSALQRQSLINALAALFAGIAAACQAGILFFQNGGS